MADYSQVMVMSSGQRNVLLSRVDGEKFDNVEYGEEGDYDFDDKMTVRDDDNDDYASFPQATVDVQQTPQTTHTRKRKRVKKKRQRVKSEMTQLPVIQPKLSNLFIS